MNNKEICKMFQKGATKGKGSNMFIEGDVLYSYGFHFPMAKRFEGYYLVTNRGYSSTTAKHMAHLRNALSYKKCLYVENPTVPRVETQIKHNLVDIEATQQKHKKARVEHSKQAHLNHIEWLKEQNQFLKEVA